MVRDSNHSLFAFVTDKIDLILDVENGRIIFLAGDVPDPALDRSWISFLSIWTHICEPHPLPSVPIYRYGSLEVFLPPSLSPTVQAIGSIVGMQGICLAVEIIYACILDPIGGPAKGLAKVGGVVGLVEVGLGESKDDVVTVEVEFLNGGSVSEKGES